MSSKKTLKIHTDETGRNTERNYQLNFLVVNNGSVSVKTPFNISAQGCGV